MRCVHIICIWQHRYIDRETYVLVCLMFIYIKLHRNCNYYRHPTRKYNMWYIVVFVLMNCLNKPIKRSKTWKPNVQLSLFSLVVISGSIYICCFRRDEKQKSISAPFPSGYTCHFISLDFFCCFVVLLLWFLLNNFRFTISFTNDLHVRISIFFYLKIQFIIGNFHGLISISILSLWRGFFR